MAVFMEISYHLMFMPTLEYIYNIFFMTKTWLEWPHIYSFPEKNNTFGITLQVYYIFLNGKNFKRIFFI